MKHLQKHYLMVILVLFLAIGIIALPRLSKPVQAAFGNNGTPVRCEPTVTGQTISPGSYEFFRCTAADGTTFTDNGQRVPESYYLIVTDIVITPDTIASDPGKFKLILYAAYGTTSRAFALRFHDISGNTVSEHFTVPYMVLPAGYRIEGLNDAGSTYELNVQISGLLVTNLNYLPLANK